MKCTSIQARRNIRRVTLSARVWIEIISIVFFVPFHPVTLSARVWIEISSQLACMLIAFVTLSARVWIEIHRRPKERQIDVGHPQCEGVD